MVYLLLYVDDIVLTTSSSVFLQKTISALQREFVMKDLGPLHHILGITVEGGQRAYSYTSTPTSRTSSTVLA
jgi:hypothetical protein